jgi:hypothetical protein
MATASTSYWSPAIQPGVATPWMILEDQARALEVQTEGVLRAEVLSTSDKATKTRILWLDIVVPDMDGYRYRVLSVTHQWDMIYPATIDADCFRRKGVEQLDEALKIVRGAKPENRAASDTEFRTLVQRVLQSDEVTSVAVSLIARANEIRAAKEHQAVLDAEQAGRDAVQAARAEAPDSDSDKAPPHPGA